MRRRLLDALTNDLLLKLTALGLAFLFWTLVKTDNRVAIDGIPVKVLNRDAAWSHVGDAIPPTVTVEFSGPVRELIRVAAERPAITIPVDEVTDTSQIELLRAAMVELGQGLENTRIEAIRPTTVRLRFDRMDSGSIPLALAVIGAPPDGFELAGPIELIPPRVRISGPSQVLAGIDTIRLAAVDISRLTTTDTQLVAVDPVARDVVVDPTEVSVIVPIRPIAPDTAAAAGARPEGGGSAGGR